jgi:hypothetical protein
MAEGILIDEKGRRWPDRSWDLLRRLGSYSADLDPASHAVRERGFIHIRPQETGARVALRVGGFGLETLAGTLYELKERRFPRIILAMFAEGEWFYEMLGSAWEFADRAEQLLTGSAGERHHPWLAAERTLAALSLPDFAQVRPLVDLWRACRGRMPKDLDSAVAGAGLLERMILVRLHASRLVFAHFGGGIECVRPGQNLLLVDRDVHDQPDRDYGAWVERAYAESIGVDRPQLRSIHATVQLSDTAAIHGRYDRLALPWRAAGDQRFVMGISLTRAVADPAIGEVRKIGEHRAGPHP